MIRFFLAGVLSMFGATLAAAASLDGVYDVDPRLCAISEQSTNRLVISGNTLSLYETDCKIAGRSDWRVALNCQNGQEKFHETARFTPVSGGVTMDGIGAGKTYLRCR